MLSLEECRLLIGDDVEISDEDLDTVRRDLYALADVATTAIMEMREEETRRDKALPLNSTLNLTPSQKHSEERRKAQ